MVMALRTKTRKRRQAARPDDIEVDVAAIADTSASQPQTVTNPDVNAHCYIDLREVCRQACISLTHMLFNGRC
jgi:hypothetical protein